MRVRKEGSTGPPTGCRCPRGSDRIAFNDRKHSSTLSCSSLEALSICKARAHCADGQCSVEHSGSGRGCVHGVLEVQKLVWETATGWRHLLMTETNRTGRESQTDRRAEIIDLENTKIENTELSHGGCAWTEGKVACEEGWRVWHEIISRNKN